ncbi:hypothetical protein SAMN02745121_01830 [Nannocystis exedens]|uniref:Uncharacterized protein n=1 Tax=Nannocystis exedens TaxID=54 RepID=A0A1I1VPP8_9BACT|nr:hypothetical protein [Nannocystis exedens]PCC72713.1 hypothetical protein NAEX_05798 [Nannocystis exedens]SFD84804.1 hypothetical protein SAMN02745121_01830 [Nannocystis exedens]
MQRRDPRETSFSRRLLRAAVLLSSTGLAALLILRAGGMTGCDGPASPPPQQPASRQPAADAAKTAPAAQTPPPAVQTSTAPVPAPQPTAPPAANKADDVEPRNLEVGKNYFPASKAGPAIHPEPFLEPAREPAVLQQAPQPTPQPQQVAPK